MNAVHSLLQDIKDGEKLSRKQARYLVDTYYLMQRYRVRTGNQVTALKKTEEPTKVLEWYLNSSKGLEKEMVKVLDEFSFSYLEGQWARSIAGVGPIIAAGLLAYVDIEKARTAGAIWRFAGLDPTLKWEKGQKRPWNANLKTLCWKLGESFVYHQSKSIYGKLFVTRKEYEHNQNDQFAYKEQALKMADHVRKDTDAYKSYIIGKLPTGHIHERAKRYAVKIFLSHYHEVLWRVYKGESCPHRPYAISILGHAHEIEVPNLGLIEV